MDFHRSRIEREGFDADTDDLFELQLLAHAIQHAIFRPPVHAHVNRVPATEPLGQPAPLAALLGHIENRMQHLQVGQTYIAALHRQAVFDARKLLFGDFHPKNILLSHCFNSVNTP